MAEQSGDNRWRQPAPLAFVPAERGRLAVSLPASPPLTRFTRSVKESEADKVEAAQHAAEHGNTPSAGAAPSPSEPGKPAPPAYEAGPTTAEPTGQYMPPSGPPPTEAAAVPAGEHPHPQQQQQVRPHSRFEGEAGTFSLSERLSTSGD